MVLLNEQGQPVQQMTPKNVGTKEPFWFPYMVANDREVLLFEAQSGTFHRYALPQ